jgi:hypothetical protein
LEERKLRKKTELNVPFGKPPLLILEDEYKLEEDQIDELVD